MPPTAGAGSPARRLDALFSRPLVRGALSAARDFLSVVAPTECVACGADDAVLCPRCRGALRAATVRPFPAHEAAESLPLLTGLEPVPALAAGVYRGELAAALLAFKNRQRVSLASVLAPALAGALRRAAGGPEAPGPSEGDREGPAGGIAVVPVPSRFSARVRRGYAPVEVLLDWVDTRGLMPPGYRIARVLRHRPGWRPGQQGAAGGPQKGKGRRARGRTRGTMAVRRGARVAGMRCVVLDDVLTTGATAAEAYRCLVEAGARVEAIVVLAATRPPRHADPTRRFSARSADGEREMWEGTLDSGRG
ncbi:MAG: ComF family protein [Arthrobacter sp.]|uniref:ComF family protein n=1 Tax=Arthrobacter sp. TaxID=1667 RepID=UPI0034853C31